MTVFEVESRRRVEMIDITAAVRDIVRAAGVTSGLALVFTPHTTAGITINENADPDVCRDILAALDKLVPLHGDYRHQEGNSAAHLKSSLFGAGETLIVSDGDLVLGTWQGLYFCEFDGPRRRRVQVQVVGA